MEKDEDFIREIATTIYSQLQDTVEPAVYASWGVCGYVGGMNNGMASLAIKVNGRLWKNWVVIAYNEGTDYYEVWLDDFKGQKSMVADDVDWVDLGRIIDQAIESGNDPEEYFMFCWDEYRSLFGEN